MSGQYGQKKKQPRGGPSGNYPLRQRPTKNQEKSVLSEGIYKNELFMFNALSVIGSTVKIWVNNGRVYEGIFRTFNAGLDMVIDNVHVVEGSKLPCKENIIPHMVFQWKDIVNMNLPDVNLEYAILGGDGCVDSSVSGRHNGRSGERELQPWVNTEEFSELEALDESNSNGWPANSMFEANETKFNYKSKYDPSLKEYTTELHRVDTEEYRTREAEAERHAQEIQSSLTYLENADLENGDEEMLFSAVHRPDETASVTAAGNGGKFAMPQHRNAQTGAVLANRPQKLVVLPSTQTEVVRSHHPPAIVPTTAAETAAAAAAAAVASSSSSGVIRINAGEARKEEIDRPPAPTTKPALGTTAAAAFEHATDKPKLSIVNVISTSVKAEPQKPRADAIQELKEFGENFKLPDAASEPKEPRHLVSQPLLTSSQTVTLAPSVAVPVALPQSQLPPNVQVASQQMALEPNHRGFQEERSEAKEDVKEDVSRKSVLNPSAKEFVPAVKAYQAPRNLPSQTPPRPPSTVGSPVYMPYIQPNTPVYHTTIMPPPGSVQQPRSAGVANKRASVSVSMRPDVNPPPQAMTGAPLITQQVMISGPAVVPGGLTMMPVHQPVIRMLPQHHQNVMIDPNQPVFAVPMASSLTSHQPPHPGTALGPATHHVIAGGALTGAMHASHGGAGIAMAPPPSQQTSGAPTPTPVHQYGQPLQPGSAMTLPTTSGTPQSPAQMQMFPGAPGGHLAMAHPQQIHPVSLQHINNPTSPIIYQTPGGLVQFPHQAPGLAYATAGPGGQQPGHGQTQMAGHHHHHQQPPPPPPPMGPSSSHVVMHGPQMMMGPQGQGAYMAMQVPGSMTQNPGFAQHPVAAFHMYSVPGGGPTFSFTP